MDSKKRIFTFDQVGENFSQEESKDAALSLTEDEIKLRNEQKTAMNVIVQNAEYCELSQRILINVRLPNGEPKAIVWDKQCFTFHGFSASEAPKDLVDQEMRKTVNLLLRKKGKSIGKVLAYSGQLESVYE